ncbi:MAG: ankyrin repeat domain-containing protein, partial [Vicinamibacterales bacterium]
MSERRLPVRPNLDQLKHQAKDLLRELRVTNPAAGLADAQFALAREYQASSWPRLVHAVRLANA